VTLDTDPLRSGQAGADRGLGGTGRAEAEKEAADRASAVTSRIDEVQFRRLQEADRARKALGLWERLKLAWRGD
jgi:hypothetical protein